MDKIETISRLRNIINEVLDGDAKVLYKIKLGELKLPHSFFEPKGDEIKLVVLDTETTGLDPEVDGITELGMVEVWYSPSEGRLQSIIRKFEAYNDPGCEISEFITEMTGITQEMVEGQNITHEDVVVWFEDDPIVVAHNAAFDRQFFERKFPELTNLRWACSKREIKWRDWFGYESDKLEYVNYKAGHFYEGHRATVDCFALINMLIKHDDIVSKLMNEVSKSSWLIRATGAPFEAKDDLKKLGFKWNPDLYGKVWVKFVSDDEFESTRNAVREIPRCARLTLPADEFTARNRFKTW